MKINVTRSFTTLEADNHILIYIFRFLNLLFMKVVIIFMLNNLITSSS